MPTSRRASHVGAMRLARLLRLAGEVDATDIALGLPTGNPPPPMLSAAVASLDSGDNQYADPAGLAALRAALARLLRDTRDVAVDPELELTVTTGATEGVFIAIVATTDPGDEVILFEPYFELYPGMVRLAGATPVSVALARPGWRVDEASLRAAVTPRTRAIVVNTPHNPTGRVFDEREIGAIVDVCTDFGLTCITDEVYEQFVFDGGRHISPLDQPGGRERTIVVSSLSKTFEASGWRIGFCFAPPGLTEGLRAVHEHVTLGASRPLQAGAAALPTAAEMSSALARRRRRFAEQRDRMVVRLRSSGFDVHRPEGAWFLLAGTAALGWSAAALAEDLVARAGVLVAPGEPFFATSTDGDRWIRATFVRDAAATEAALDRLAGHVGHHRPRRTVTSTEDSR